MHSSRMRTVHCIGRLSCHACPLPRMSPLPCTAFPLPHTPCHACPLPCTHPHYAFSLPLTPPATQAPPLPPHMPLPCTPSPVDRILDTYLSKHYLSATIVADGKYLTTADLDIGVFYSKLEYHRYANQLYS